MQDVMINHPGYAYLFLLVIAIGVVAAIGFRLRERALARFVSAKLRSLLVGAVSTTRQRIKTGLAVGALALIVVGLMDIRWGREWREVPQAGVEVMFVLDVSRSMLAQDTSPTRLARAKQYIQDVVDQLEGDRVGLVVFAGQPNQKVPLTSNYHDFNLSLSEVGPHSAPRGGSRLGDAIRAAADAFVDTTPDHKAILVIADGEDQESDPVRAAKSVYEDRGIRVFSVGIGDMDRGAMIQLASDRYLHHDGQAVVTRMDGQTLEAVALAGGGAFVPAGTSWVDMGGVYRTHVGSIEARSFDDARAQTWIPRYAWFVAAALILLFAEGLLGERRRRHAAQGAAYAGAMAVAMFAAMPGLAQDSQTPPADAYDAYNQSVERYQADDLEGANTLLVAALDSAAAEVVAPARYNLGNINYTRALESIEQQDRAGAIDQLNTAVNHYRAALRSNPYDTDARANIELAHMLIDQLQEEQKQEEQKQQQQDQQQQNQDQQNQEQQQDAQQDQSTQQQDAQQQDQSEQNNQEQQAQDQSQQEQQSEQEQSQQKQPQDESSQNSPDAQGQTPESQEEPADTAQDERQGQPQDPQQDQGQEQLGQEEQPQAEDLSQGKAEANPDVSEEEQSGQPVAVAEDQMTEDEAAKLLQAIRDQEYERRARQQYLEARQQRPVERDW